MTHMVWVMTVVTVTKCRDSGGIMAQSWKMDRRTGIARAVVEIVAEHGLSALSLRAVARVAGVSMGAVQHHFESVAELVREGLAQTLADLSEVFRREVHRSRGLEIFQGRPAGLLGDDPEVSRLLRAYAQLRTLSMVDPDVAETVARFERGQVEVLADAIIEGQRREILHPSIDARPSAGVLWLVLMGIAVDVAFGIRDREDAWTTLRYHFMTLAWARDAMHLGVSDCA